MRINVNSPRFDEEIRKLASMEEGDIIAEVLENDALRFYLGEACAPAYKRDVRWYSDSKVYPERYRNWFTNWNMKDWENFQKKDEHSVAYWAPKIVEMLAWYNDWPEAKEWWKKHGEELNETRTRKLVNFMESVPAIYRNASIDDFSSGVGKEIVQGVLERGESYLLYGGRGIGKTHLCWALTIALVKAEKEARFYDARTIFSKLSIISKNSYRSVTELVDEQLSKHPEVLFIDEVDKLDRGSSDSKNLQFLISRRSEELKQTIICCNAENDQDLSMILGESAIDRFRSQKWKAHIVNLGVKGKRGTVVEMSYRGGMNV